ncbi:hypothetical protein LTR94_037911, partial [Friedmanniomyces endolithicus]
RIIQASETFVAPESAESACDIWRRRAARQGGAHGRSDFSETYAFFFSEDLKFGFQSKDVPALEKTQSFTQS